MDREELTVRRRVKLYLLNEENEWDDGGTGYVAVVLGQNQTDMNLLVNSEADSSALLDTKIDIDVAYQKQQDTLIVWFDNEAQNNLALSFQEAAGCDEIWAKICQIHGKPPTVKSTGDDDVEGSPKDNGQGGQHRNSMNRMNAATTIALPPCDLAHLDELLNAIRDNSRMPNRREKLALAIESGNYIHKLSQIFHMAEDLESSEILVKLYEIIKFLFHLNRSSLLDIMLADSLVMDVVGMLEYDPNLKEQAAHRRFLCDRARFHQVLPIKNKELLAKIERTFRLQYIQDVVQPLPLTILDTDTTLSALSSQIYFNKMEIVMSIQNDGPFLEQLFRQLLSSTYCDDAMSTTSSTPEEGSDLANSHTSVGSAPTESEKESFSSLAKSQVEDASALKNGIGSDDEASDSCSLKTDSASTLNGNKAKIVRNGLENHAEKKSIEHPVPGKLISDEHRFELVLLLRELCNYAHSLQPEPRADFLKRLNEYKICAVIEQLLTLESLDIRQAAIDIFASLVDFSPSMIRDYALRSSTGDDVDHQAKDDDLLSLVIAELLNDSDPELGSAFHLANLLRLLLDPENMMPTGTYRSTEKVDFLSMFYRDCMHALVAPLLANTADCKKPHRDDYRTALQTNLIVELLTFCLEVHGQHVRRYIISRDLVRRVLVLLKSRHVMLILSALRFFRRTIGLKDPVYSDHIISNQLFEPVVEAMLTNKRDNMLQSAFHELFQFIRNEPVDEIICHLIDNYGDKLPPNNNRPDPLGTFTSMRDRSALVREQMAAAPRQLSAVSPEPGTMPSPGSWTSATSRAQLQYASGGMQGLPPFMRIGMSNGSSTGNTGVVLQSQPQRLPNNTGGLVAVPAGPMQMANNGPNRVGSNGGATGPASYLEDEDLEDEDKWFDSDDPAPAPADPTVIRQGGEGLADVSAVDGANGAAEAMEPQHCDEVARRPHSAPAAQTLSAQDSEAVLDQLHLRMIEARRARDDDEVLLPARTSPLPTGPVVPLASGGVKRSTSGLTISINVTSKSSPAVSPSASTTSVRTSLVDYGSDSDDTEDSDDEKSEKERQSLKTKGGSGAAEGLDDDDEKGGQTKRFRSSLSPVDPERPGESSSVERVRQEEGERSVNDSGNKPADSDNQPKEETSPPNSDDSTTVGS